MWSWVLHRITGVAIFFFLLVHSLDTALVRVSPEAYNAVIGTYKNPIMGIGEVFLVGAIAYHAYNGLRIIIVDFWSKGARYQRQLWWIVLGVWAVTMIGFTPRHLITCGLTGRLTCRRLTRPRLTCRRLTCPRLTGRRLTCPRLTTH